MLRVLGLDEAEERAYRRLIEVPSGSAADLTEFLDCPVAQAESVLAALEAKGLAARSSGGSHRFVASPPQVALGALMAAQHEDLRRAQSELAALTERYRDAAADRTVNDVVDVVLGPQAVAQRFAQLQRSAQRDLRLLVQSQYVVVTPEQNVDEDLALARGVDYRVVVERSHFKREGFHALAMASIDNGVRIRVADQVPTRLLIADGELGLVPLSPSTGANPGSGALLIHPSGLLDALIGLYDLMWQGSAELIGTDETVGDVNGDTISELDSQVLSLLLAGLTDQAIGGQLELSLRTVQRRVRVLMDRAQVHTRLQLGYQAGRRGWL